MAQIVLAGVGPKSRLIDILFIFFYPRGRNFLKLLGGIPYTARAWW